MSVVAIESHCMKTVMIHLVDKSAWGGGGKSHILRYGMCHFFEGTFLAGK